MIIRRRVNSSTGAAPVVILDGRRDNGAIISGVFAEPQWPGKAIYATATGNDSKQV